MSWWTWYFGIGLLVLVLVVAWDWHTGLHVSSSKSASDQLIVLAAAIAVVPVWPIVLFVQLWEMAKYMADPPQRYVKFKFSRHHLVRKVSVQEAEDLERVVDPLGAVPDLPFGFLNAAWQNFLDQLTPIDSLWILSATAMNGSRMEKREGYAIVRFGWIMRTLLTSRTGIGEEE